MKPLVWILLGVLMTVLFQMLWSSKWSFSAQKPGDYAADGPVLDIREALGGRYLSEGVIFDYTGRAKARFKAVMTGQFSASGGVLDEEFTYASGAKQTRQWRLNFLSAETFSATADDIIGEASGTISGNTIRMQYKLRLSEDAGGHVLDVVDWMYLTDEGTIINRSEMRKFGLKVAELNAVFKHRDIAETMLLEAAE